MPEVNPAPPPSTAAKLGISIARALLDFERCVHLLAVAHDIWLAAEQRQQEER